MSVAAEPEGQVWSVRRVLTWATEDFRKRGLESPRLEAELLLGGTLGLDRIALILQAERPLMPTELNHYRKLIQRRRGGEPMAYILGSREFFGLKLRTDARALIPRPDTEILVESALERTRSRHLQGQALDLCTGSGCVAIAFAKARPTWLVTATDLSTQALELAQENALRTGTARALIFRAGDLYGAVPAAARYTLIVSNPPYIPHDEIAELPPGIRDFEPRQALDGGPDGLDLVRTVIEGAPAQLEPGGILCIEVAYDQAERTARLFEERGFQAIARHRDLGGHERVVSGCYGPP